MKYIIVDLEATCWEKKEGRQNEIIEIGAVCIDEAGNSISEFNQLITPARNPILSEFCIELTTITQDMVDTGLPFPQGLQLYLDWINSFEDAYLICSWGYYDRVQFENDCRQHELATDWLSNHISLKHQYAKIKSLRRPMGMKGVLKREKIELVGTHHRGIDDARNIAKIFVKYINQWNPAGIKRK